MFAVPEELTGKPFTVAQAREVGLSPHRLRTSAFRRLFRDAYVAADVEVTLNVRCRALALTLPAEAVFSHWTAGALYGLPLAPRDELHVTMPRPLWVTQSRDSVVAHERLRSDHPGLVRGIHTCSLQRLFVDLAQHLDYERLVALGDQALRHGLTQTELKTELVEAHGCRGVVLARRAAAALRENVDSPGETSLRLVIVGAGLPEPEVAVVVRDAAGGWVGVSDLGYSRQRVAIQYEGDVHRVKQRRWRQDVARDEAFRDVGWEVLRATAADIAQPQAFLARLRRLLSQGR